MAPTRPLEAVYEDIWDVEQVAAWLLTQESLQPRPPSSLFDMVAELGLTAESRILEAGCGQGHHACALALRFGSQVIALDPLEPNLDLTRKNIAQENVAHLVTVQKGTLEHLPLETATVDLVWCRGVLPHLPDAAAALQDCGRVLKPGGFLLLQTGFATPMLAPNEAEALYQRMGFVAESMNQPAIEQLLEQQGWTMVKNERLSSEYAEFYEQRDGRCAKYLLALAKLLRSEAAVVEQFSRPVYETTLGVFHWQLYQMLGKVSYHAYLLQKQPLSLPPTR